MLIEKPRYINLLIPEICDACPVMQEAIAALVQSAKNNQELINMIPYIIECAPGRVKQLGLIEQPGRKFTAFWRRQNFLDLLPEREVSKVEVNEDEVSVLMVYGKNRECPHGFDIIPDPSSA